MSFTVGRAKVQEVSFSLADGDQKDLYSWTLQVPLTPISMAATRKRKAGVMDEDEQEVAEGEKQEEAGEEEGKKDEDRANLDKFMTNNSSEDIKSFIELQLETEKNRAKNAWIH